MRASTGSTRRRLWVFNLDAEIELERGGGGGPYQAPQRVLDGLRPSLGDARRVMAEGDASLDDLDDALTADAPRPAQSPEQPWLGAAWCPTPSALRRLARAGAELPSSPSLAILRQVNHRRFYLELGGGAPGARYVEVADELRSTLAERRVWLFKRPFSFAGRGQRRIPLTPSKDDERWLADGLRLGGLLAEPWLELEREVAIHGVLDAQGRLALGAVCVQETNSFRAWVATRRAGAGDVGPSDVQALRSRAESVAAALSDAGYFGPFGLDAYFFKSAAGASVLNPLGELNARFSMGFPVGDPRFPNEDVGPSAP